MNRIGIADTTFARADMGSLCEKTLLSEAKAMGKKISIERCTVPGIKDLPVACKKLFGEKKCDLVIALGMAGPKPVDKQCSHEASLGIQAVQLLSGRHILEVFVHEDEAEGNDALLAKIMANRTKGHALNALWLLFEPETMRKRAGTARRQGFADEKSFKLG